MHKHYITCKYFFMYVINSVSIIFKLNKYLTLGPNRAVTGGPNVFCNMWLNMGDLMWFVKASMRGWQIFCSWDLFGKVVGPLTGIGLSTCEND